MKENYTTQQMEKLQRINDQMRGCMATVIFIMLGTMMGGLVFLAKHEYKHNKKHPNVISYMNETDKKIIISDVKTKEERLLDYSKMDEN